MAFVFTVIFSSIFCGSIRKVSSVQSTNTGVAPTAAIASAVAKKDIAVVITCLLYTSGQGALVVKIHEQMPVGLKQPGHGVGREPVVKGQKLGQVVQLCRPGFARRAVSAWVDSHLAQTGLFVKEP